jgi:hypothetical protein
MPTEIKYAVSFSMLNIQAERRAEGKISLVLRCIQGGD